MDAFADYAHAKKLNTCMEWKQASIFALDEGANDNVHVLNACMTSIHVCIICMHPMNAYVQWISVCNDDMHSMDVCM